MAKKKSARKKFAEERCDLKTAYVVAAFRNLKEDTGLSLKEACQVLDEITDMDPFVLQGEKFRGKDVGWYLDKKC